jgi:hypothetical protein
MCVCLIGFSPERLDVLRCPVARSPTGCLNKEPRGESSYLEAGNRRTVGRSPLVVLEASLPHAVLNQKYPVHKPANHISNTSHKYLTNLKGFIKSEFQRGQLLNKKGDENILNRKFFKIL